MKKLLTSLLVALFVLGSLSSVAGAEALPAWVRADPKSIGDSVVVYSTLDDLLVWQRALHRGELLTPFSYQQMLTDHSPADTPKERGREHRDWGYGIFSKRLGQQVKPSFEDRQIYHTGSWAGFRNLISYLPSEDVIVVVLTNNYNQRDEVLQKLTSKVLCFRQ